MSTLSISNCKTSESVNYREIKLTEVAIEHTTDDMPYVTDAVRSPNKIIVNAKKIWLIDFEKKFEKIIIKNGIGPDEIYKPNVLKYFNDKVWVNSYLPNKYLYSFSPFLENLEIWRKEYDTSYSADDFCLLSENEVAMVNVYWSEGILRTFNFNTGKSKTYKRPLPTFIDIMDRFNISNASLCVIGDNAYITQSIIPEIKIVPLKDGQKRIGKLTLSPPFYIPHPEKYSVIKYDDKEHKKWMASWTSIKKILSYKEWLLVQYGWGYDPSYAYELIKIKNTGQRYFISKSGYGIYDFSIKEDNRAVFYVYEEFGDKLIWKITEASL